MPPTLPMAREGVRSAFSDDETEYDSDEPGSESEDSEDNVPLAQRIPGALQAQKSIRIKDKAERERRRKERHALKQKPRPRPEPLAAGEFTQRLPHSSPPASTPRTKDALRRLSNPRVLSPQSQHDSNDAPSLARQQTTARPGNVSGPPAASSALLPTRTATTPAIAHRQQTSASTDAYSHRSHDAPVQRDAGVIRAHSVTSNVRPARRVLQRTRTAGPLPPAPLPTVSQEVERTSDPNSTQHRVFIGDMQRFNTVEIGSQTRARDVLDLVEAQGELRGEAAALPGGWMLWEIAQDFGMERPLREFELPAEVYASWNSNTRLNSFMIKKTPLAPLLARTAMPTSSPTYSGHVQWESKRGKWNKRWMELREHSLWLSKRDNGKESTFLCSLSNFDCYYVSRLHKAPKPFVFAVKSTDNLTLFENPADYLHVFACDPKDGQRWMERILLARSYVLHKERTVLFSVAVSSLASSANPNTHKITSSSRTAAPLVNAGALQAPARPSTIKNPFQTGSLLAKAST